MWAGLCLSYAAPVLPPSFTIIAFAAAEFALAAGYRWLRESGRLAAPSGNRARPVHGPPS